MKPWIAAIALSSCLGCAPPPFEAPRAVESGGPVTVLPISTQPGDLIENQKGHVTQVGSLGFGLVPDADPGTRFAAQELAAEFRQEGLRIVFSGVVLESPRGVREWGIPLKVTSIRTE